LRRFQAAAVAPSRRLSVPFTAYLTTAAALGLAWYATPEGVAALLAERLPQLGISRDGQAQSSHPGGRDGPAAMIALQRPAPDAASGADKAPIKPVAVREPALALAVVAEPAEDADATAAEASESDEAMVKVVEVEKGDTLINILVASGVGRAEAMEAINALRPVFRPKDLMPGQEITLNFDRAQVDAADERGLQLAGLSLQPSVERDVVVNRNDNGEFVAAAIERPLSVQVALATGSINSSFFEAGRDAAVPLETLTQVIKAFSYDIDFQREIHPGARFEIVYERHEDENGRLARTGRVLYAALIQNGVAKEIYRFEPSGGAADFFNAKGESIRKELLRTPLDIVRVTSTFGMRKHPILGYSRMHKGVDFAASTGTPIFAAGNGVIVRMEKQHGYGNYIRIKHNSKYATAYAHMSRFAKGLKKGSKVNQGDVIGFVGSTGMATGPHLHYEILVDGAQVNPMNVKLAGRKVEGKDLQRFEALKADIGKLRRKLAEQILIARNQGL
jgi:murein DD-endopeptidase MepM/ murein hydrolase activator NlpD